jgi:hypothetical protein
MIKPLDPNDSQDNRNINLLNKINELISEHNQLVDDYVNHYHTALDTKYHTTGPEAGGPNGNEPEVEEDANSNS